MSDIKENRTKMKPCKTCKLVTAIVSAQYETKCVQKYRHWEIWCSKIHNHVFASTVTQHNTSGVHN